MFQPSGALYSENAGIKYENLELPHFDVRAPTSSDIPPNFPLGKWWVWPGNGLWELNQLSSAGGQLTATWIQLASGSGAVVAVTGTANEITATPSGTTTNLSIPTTFIAPGSIASTTTVTAGTGLTVTTGNATVSAGNFVVTAGSVTASGNIVSTAGNLEATGAGTGLVLDPTVVAAGASPQTANGRVFAVTFSGVSIASGASQTFVIDNTAITGTTTQVLLEWSGATAGSALSIESQAQTAGTITIIMTNGTSATMVTSVANITFVGIVLN